MKEPKQRQSAPKPAAPIKAYRLARVGLTERRLEEYTIDGDKVTATKIGEPDLGTIVIGKFLRELASEEESA